MQTSIIFLQCVRTRFSPTNKFNVNTSKNQRISLSISSENSDETIDYIAFLLIYRYNEGDSIYNEPNQIIGFSKIQIKRIY